MAYPIPKSIAYEEKIAFGLTLKQLGYAIIGIAIAYNLFNIFAPFDFTIAAVIAYFVIMITAGFIFLDLEEKLLMLLDYHLNVKHGGFDSPEVKKFMEVASIRDDIIFLKNGEMRAVIRVRPVNFSTIDEEKKERITALFASFLQQLEGPIQLHVRTVNVDIRDQLDAWEKQIEKRNKELLPLFKDFRKYEERLLRENTVRERLFYIIVPFTPVKNAKDNIDQLNRKVQIIQEALFGIGLANNRLTSDELVAFLASYFEERLLVRNEYLGGRTLLSRWIESRDEKIAPKLKDEMLSSILCPSRIETTPEYIRINEIYYRPIIGVGFPKYVESGWLERLIGTRDNYDISIHIEPTSIEAAKVMLHKQIVKEEADLAISMAKGVPNPSLENLLADTKEFFDWLDRGEEQLFSVSIYVVAKARTKDELDFLTAKCKSDLNAVSIIPKIPYYQMATALKSAMPLGLDRIKKVREFPTSTLAASFPFMTTTVESDESGNGTLIAHDRATLNPIIVDFNKLSNAHFMLLAKSGAGKSYTSKLLLTRMLMNGARIYVVDPNGEYNRLCQHYAGERIILSRDSPNIINPLDLFNEDYADKRISLIAIFSIICNGLSPVAEGIIDRVLNAVYEKKGITNDPETWNKRPPIMSDVLAELEEEKKRLEKIQNKTELKEVQMLITKISRYTKKGVYGFVDKQTKLDTSKGFVVFDINELPDEVKPLFMFLVLDYIINITKSNLDKKAVVIDEGWSLLNNPKTAEHLLWLIKASRKFNTSMIFITQEVNDLLGTKAGESILANTAIKIMLAQDETVINALSDIMHLNETEKTLLTVAKRGEGILFIENSVRVPIIITASPKEHELITTHPEELKAIQEEKKAVKERENARSKSKGNDK
ncbi:MAG: DUF87 domain-containing protein [Candidatus Micrarchaeia archaeon]